MHRNEKLCASLWKNMQLVLAEFLYATCISRVFICNLY